MTLFSLKALVVEQIYEGQIQAKGVKLVGGPLFMEAVRSRRREGFPVDGLTLSGCRLSEGDVVYCSLDKAPASPLNWRNPTNYAVPVKR